MPTPQTKQTQTVLELVKIRHKTAKTYTKKFIDEVKRCIDDYRCEKDEGKDNTPYDRHLTRKRYSFRVPYIYSTHESMMSTLFEKPFELIITGKAKNDDAKGDLINSIYKYLHDKLDLESFRDDLSWNFILMGFVSSYQEYKYEVSGYENVLDAEGNPIMEGEEQVQTPIVEEDDPCIYVDDPLKTFYSPDSEFSVDGEKVGYIVREKTMDKDEVNQIFKKSVEADSEIELDDKKMSEDEKADLERVCVKYYTGHLPSSVSDDLLTKYKLEWKYDTDYIIAFTTKTLLSIEEKEEYLTLARWFKTPDKFFGFGIGRTLRDVQREMSIRRGQQIRYADLYAFPWLMVGGKTKIDPKAVNDPMKRSPLVWEAQQGGQPPQYLVPPQMPATITQADEIARSDAQFISGTLDLSKGAQDTNTVETATGQQLFAQSADKRMQRARTLIAQSYKQAVINLFKLCQERWPEEKIIAITDEDGNSTEVVVQKADLADIDFDTDIDISIDSISENKNTIAQREIALYDKLNGDPMIDQRELKKGLLRTGFNKKNPDSLLLSDEQMMANQPPDMGAVPPGTPPAPDMGLPDTNSLPLIGNEQAPNPQQGFTPTQPLG